MPGSALLNAREGRAISHGGHTMNGTHIITHVENWTFESLWAFEDGRAAACGRVVVSR